MKRSPTCYSSRAYNGKHEDTIDRRGAETYRRCTLCGEQEYRGEWPFPIHTPPVFTAEQEKEIRRIIKEAINESKGT